MSFLRRGQKFEVWMKLCREDADNPDITIVESHWYSRVIRGRERAEELADRLRRDNRFGGARHWVEVTIVPMS